MLVILLHVVVFLFFSLESFIIVVILINESILMLAECRNGEREIEEASASHNYSVTKEKELEQKYKEIKIRSKACIKKWVWFILYVFVNNKIKNVSWIKEYKLYVNSVKLLFVVVLTS